MRNAGLPPDPESLREEVRRGYTEIAARASCCPGGRPARAVEVGRRIGYADAELASVPEGANLGVGCGNPTAIAALRPGEVVLDLGSGAGMDAFLAARAVGPTGRVIGVDMTDAMLEKARRNARAIGLANVEFRKGYIEDLPLDDESVDVILSNCVINLSPQKEKVYREAWRVLRPGGRLMVSDIVLEAPLPPEVAGNLDVYLGCVGGASLRADYLRTVAEAGFRELRIVRETCFGDVIGSDHPLVRDAMAQHGLGVDRIREVLATLTSLHLFASK